MNKDEFKKITAALRKVLELDEYGHLDIAILISDDTDNTFGIVGNSCQLCMLEAYKSYCADNNIEHDGNGVVH